MPPIGEAGVPCKDPGVEAGDWPTAAIENRAYAFCSEAKRAAAAAAYIRLAKTLGR